MDATDGETQHTAATATDRPDLELPDVLDGGSVDRCFQQLREEWRPDTPTQEFLAREMARHEVALNRAEQIEAAILRRGSRAASRIPSDLASADALADAALAGAGITDALERISAYRRAHERAYHRSYAALSELKAAAADAPAQPSDRPEAGFKTEAECEQYLIARVWRCPHCGSSPGRWIASRRVCACPLCHREASLRTGTVAARSGVPLFVWFRAIAALLTNRDLTTADLSVATGIHRAGTVRRIARRIRQALDSADATMQLMGLDHVRAAPQITPGPSGKRSEKSSF